MWIHCKHILKQERPSRNGWTCWGPLARTTAAHGILDKHSIFFWALWHRRASHSLCAPPLFHATPHLSKLTPALDSNWFSSLTSLESRIKGWDSQDGSRLEEVEDRWHRSPSSCVPPLSLTWPLSAPLIDHALFPTNFFSVKATGCLLKPAGIPHSLSSLGLFPSGFHLAIFWFCFYDPCTHCPLGGKIRLFKSHFYKMGEDATGREVKRALKGREEFLALCILRARNVSASWPLPLPLQDEISC